MLEALIHYFLTLDPPPPPYTHTHKNRCTVPGPNTSDRPVTLCIRFANHITIWALSYVFSGNYPCICVTIAHHAIICHFTMHLLGY